MVPIKIREYQVFQEFLQERSAIQLGDGKEYLVTSRRNNLMTEAGIENLTECLERLKSPRNKRLSVDVIDAMTTNETYWFRDNVQFSLIKNSVLPELEKTGEESALLVYGLF